MPPEYEQRIEGHKLGSVIVLARLGRTTSDQQWRLNGLRVCDTSMSRICTNSDINSRCLLQYIQRLCEKLPEIRQSSHPADAVTIEFVEFNPHHATPPIMYVRPLLVYVGPPHHV